MNKKTAISLDNYTVFRLLCELERGEVTSQRDLSKRLDSALGLVNGYLKACTDNGWIGVAEKTGTRAKYQLTLKGSAEKRRLALVHSRYIDEMLAVVTEEYRNIAQRLREEGLDRVALCGIDAVSGVALLTLKDSGVEPSIVMDTEGIGENFMGCEIISIARAMLAGVHRVVITSLKRAPELHDSLLEMGTDPDVIFVPSIFLGSDK